MSNKLYAERDIEGLDEDGNFYFKHVMAMTAESLHGKSAIAAELGYRDSKIVELQARLEHAVSQRDNALAQNAELVAQVERLRAALTGLKESYCRDPFKATSAERAEDGKRLSEVSDLIKLTPTQCLREVEAKAGRAGFVAGYMLCNDGSPLIAHNYQGFADNYAESIKAGNHEKV